MLSVWLWSPIPAAPGSLEMQAADCHLKGEETRGTPRLLVSAGTFLGEITSSSL